MGIQSTQGMLFKLVANDVDLDLFDDEEIKVSDNITGLFDLGTLPSDFTRDITLPGTKKNNAFFEHVYDISVLNPILFTTNAKIPCFLDFGGIYLAQGYMQLNRVNVLANKFIESYEVSVYGALSSFAREINRSFLTDMTASLAQYNHTASLENITGSWNRELFNGDIVYPFAEYGQKIRFTPEDRLNGIDSASGSLFVQDYKPAIRIKKVWDAIFDEYGFTYTGSFFDRPFLNQVYMVCNNQLRYPIFDEVDLETYGQFRAGISSGSTDITIAPNVITELPYFNIFDNAGGNLSDDLVYTLDYPTTVRGEFKLNVRVEKTSPGDGVPQFDLVIVDTQSNEVASVELNTFNDFFNEVRIGYVSQNVDTETQTYFLETEYVTPYLQSGQYRFAIRYSVLGTNNFSVILDPSGQLKSTISVTKVGNVGEGFVMKIGQNMPFGTKGIRKIDFITSIQKKFNLIIYPSKINRNEFIVETFNEWYKKGQIRDFNRFMNLDKPIEVIPANNLAVNELNFGDTLDKDYISQQFNNLSNREYGKNYYLDTQNFFSQGEFTVETGFASSPLIYLEGTGVSGSASTLLGYRVLVDNEFERSEPTTCPFDPFAPDTEIWRTKVFLQDALGNSQINEGDDVVVLVRFVIFPCFGGSQTFNVTITIPFGESSAFYEYNRVEFLDCGFGSECFQEVQEAECVISVTNASLSPTSNLLSC